MHCYQKKGVCVLSPVHRNKQKEDKCVLSENCGLEDNGCQTESELSDTKMRQTDLEIGNDKMCQTDHSISAECNDKKVSNRLFNSDR